jgi:hypothetical protein
MLKDYHSQTERHKGVAADLQKMILDNSIDAAHGFSAQEYFERICSEKSSALRSLSNLGHEACACMIVNNYPGNVLELAAGFEAATFAVNILTGQTAATDSLPSKVSVRSLVFGVAWMGVSLCQRFMLQGQLGVLAVGVHAALNS